MRGKSRLTGPAIVLLAGGVVVWTGVNVHDGVTRMRRPPTAPAAIVPDWESYAAAGPRLGPLQAKVTLVEFLDYECPACRVLERRLQALRRAYAGSLAVVLRHFPLPTHESAAAAARAAVCAAVQGKFEAFHEALFAESVAAWRPWSRLADGAGVRDTLAFQECLESSAATATVHADMQAADRLGAPGTPTLLVNSEMYVSVPWDLERIVSRQMAATAKPER